MSEPHTEDYSAELRRGGDPSLLEPYLSPMEIKFPA